MGIVSRLFRGIFGLAPGILDFAFGLFRGTLHLRFGIVRPFPRLAFNASGDVLHFPFNTVLIHFCSPLRFVPSIQFPARPGQLWLRRFFVGSADPFLCRSWIAFRRIRFVNEHYPGDSAILVPN
jgi:hypothetical protein